MHEWDHDTSLDWHLLQWAPHQGIQRWVRDLNKVYRREPALHQLDCDSAGFEWIDANDYETASSASCVKAKMPRSSANNPQSHAVRALPIASASPTPAAGTNPQQRRPGIRGSGMGNAGCAYADREPYMPRAFAEFGSAAAGSADAQMAALTYNLVAQTASLM